MGDDHRLDAGLEYGPNGIREGLGVAMLASPLKIPQIPAALADQPRLGRPQLYEFREQLPPR
jgi:hypothetical protein